MSDLVENLAKLSIGGCAGCLSRTAVSPLERLKILYQVQYVTLNENSAGAERKYKSFGDSLRKIWLEEGLAGFWKGNFVNCLRVYPYIGTQFMCFSIFKNMLLDETDENAKLAPFQKLVVGSLSGVVSVMATYPLDLIRGNLTAQGGALKTNYKGLTDAFIRIPQERGWLGLYQGMTPNLCGIVPYVGINYLVYETLKENATVLYGDTNNHPLILLICGGLAGCTGQTVAYPFDLLRRRFQMPNSPYKNGLTNAIKTIYSQEGFQGLYKGYLPNFIKVVPTIGIMFMANDVLKRWVASVTKTDLR
eukprot:g100.t1